MELADHFRTIWSRRWIVLGAAVAAAVVVLFWRFNQPTSFRVETQIEVVAAASGEGTRPAGEDALFIAEGYAQRARSRPVLGDAGSASGLGLDPAEVEARVDVATDPDAGTIVVTATGNSAAEAAALSDAVAGSLIRTVETAQQQAAAQELQPVRAEIDELAAQLAALPTDDPGRGAVQARHDALVDAALDRELRAVDRLTIMSPADIASDPVGPRPIRDSVLAFLVALVLSAEAVAVVSALSGRFSRGQVREDVATAAGLPVLATVRRGPAAARRESVWELRTNLALMTPSFDASSTVAVLGTNPGVGCTRIAIDLACTASVGGRSVLLIDGDLRSPTLHKRLGISPRPGLLDALKGGLLAPQRVPADKGPPSLFILPVGDPHEDPVLTLTEHLRERVLEPAAKRGALIIIDTSPFSAFADAAVIAAQCDTTLLVVDAGKTARCALTDALARLRQVGIVPLGVVLNGVPRRSRVPRLPRLRHVRARFGRAESETSAGPAMPDGRRGEATNGDGQTVPERAAHH